MFSTVQSLVQQRVHERVITNYGNALFPLLFLSFRRNHYILIKLHQVKTVSKFLYPSRNESNPKTTGIGRLPTSNNYLNTVKPGYSGALIR